MGLEKRDNFTTYATIISDGSIRVKTSESDPDAVKREYELSDGTTGVKYELKYDNLRGMIKDIDFREGDFGQQMFVTIDDITLAVGTDNSFGRDLMSKLPGVDLTKEVNLVPYAFENDKRKTQKGITVYQTDEENNPQKIANFFLNEETKKTDLHDYPQVEKEYNEMDKDDWKLYFITVKKFLVKYIESNIKPQLEANSGVAVDDIDFGDTPQE
ncbi:MAG: hypothetical protein H6743_03900 [Rickettsiaceae bacterium]|nr:hypothetical protein [Rickettsiaceae bacterium]